MLVLDHSYNIRNQQQKEFFWLISRSARDFWMKLNKKVLNRKIITTGKKFACSWLIQRKLYLS